MSENQKISEADVGIILRAFEEQCHAHDAGIKAIQIHIDASGTATGVRLKNMEDHLARLNGSVDDLYKKHEERGKVVKEFYVVRDEFRRRTKKVDWAKKNWWVITLLLMGLIVVVVTVLDWVGLRGLFNAVKNVKDVL